MKALVELLSSADWEAIGTLVSLGLNALAAKWILKIKKKQAQRDEREKGA
jgi:hypothetical protein